MNPMNLMNRPARNIVYGNRGGKGDTGRKIGTAHVRFTTGIKRMTLRKTAWLFLVVAVVGVPASADAQAEHLGRLAEELDQPPRVRVGRGDVHQGDLYAFGDRVDIEGRLDGDLVTVARVVYLDGQIEGDVFAAADQIDIRGTVGDSTRVTANRIYVDGTIDGDLNAAGNEVRLGKNSQIKDRLRAAGRIVEIDGTVDGDVIAYAGEVIISGTVRGGATIRAETIDLAPNAYIGGDLDYTARTPLSPEALARVSGTVQFTPASEVGGDDEDAGITTWSVAFWIWMTSAALLSGLILVALFRRLVPSLVSAVKGQAVIGTLLGFGAVLAVPAAAIVAMVTLVGLPVGVAGLLLFAVALYIAKLPVAAWAGGQVLALAGRPNASPYATMAVGVVLLYALFTIPYLGGLVYLIATWLGLGAMILAGRQYLQTRAP